MSKNAMYILIAIVIAVLIALFVMPQQTAQVPVTVDVPVTATPTNGMMDEGTNDSMAEPADHMPEMPAAAEGAMEVDGVPSGTEVTGEPTDTTGTTPAPETTDTAEEPADEMNNQDQAPAAQ